MDSDVVAGLYALGGAAIALGGTWLGAIMNSRSADRTTKATIEGNSKDIEAQIQASEVTTKAQIESALTTVKSQIEADRQNRIWEKRAAVYVEIVKLLRRQQDIRHSQVQHLLTGAEPSNAPAPVDLQTFEAEVHAYGSPDVVETLMAAMHAGASFLSDYQAVEDMAPGSQRGGLIQRVLLEANQADDLEANLLVIIRAELQAKTGTDPRPPVTHARHWLDASLAGDSQQFPADSQTGSITSESYDPSPAAHPPED